MGITWSQQNCVYMASDIYPGSFSGLPVAMAEYNGAIYFRATGNASGAELWKYENGVSSMVEDINPGSASSLVNHLTPFDGDLYFTATTATYGLELYKYDGISVSLAADIKPGPGFSYVTELTVIGSELFFIANDGTHGMEPWKFDGTTATMIGDVNPGVESSNPSHFASLGTDIFFPAYHPTYGMELWKYDGVSVTVEDIYPGAFGSDIGEMTVVGSKLCFRATNGTQGYELWVHDGTSASCLDLNTTAPGDFTPWEFTPFNGEVYFRGYMASTGYELWKFDGTTASMIQDILPGSGNAHPNHLIATNSVLYFAANDGTAGNELWSYDGVTASLVVDLNPGSGAAMPISVTEEFEVKGDTVFFIGDNGSTGDEIWMYDGNSVQLGRDIISGSGTSSASGLLAHGNSIFFTADNTIDGFELWEWNLDNVLEDTITVVTCGDYTSPGGDLYTAQGNYLFTDVISSLNCPGCDSLITVDLTITNPDTSMTVYACNEYYTPSGNYYNTLGNFVFTDIVPSIACPGVDSIINIDLTITDNLDLTIYAFSGVVFVNQNGAIYQWLDCDNNYAPIAGATDQDFVPTSDGNYACYVTLGNCSDTTVCKYVESTFGVGISENDNPTINLYPNPTHDMVYLSAPNQIIQSIELIDIKGQIMRSYEDITTNPFEIEIGQFDGGVYFLEIQTDRRRWRKRLIIQ